MATTREIFYGMQIIVGKMTEEKLDGYEINSEHDRIWCGEYDPTIMAEQEMVELEQLGWFEDEGLWSVYT